MLLHTRAYQLSTLVHHHDRLNKRWNEYVGEHPTDLIYWKYFLLISLTRMSAFFPSCRTHDGKPLRNTDKHKLTKSDNAVQLAIYDVRKEDSGTYKLFAKTDAGDHSHKTFKLFVNDKTNGAGGSAAPPEFLRRLQDISVKIGTHTRLLVELRSASDVKVNWFRNERRVIEDERITLVHEGTFYCVEISAVSMDDGGTWTCLAENGEGRNSTVANFNVLGEFSSFYSVVSRSRDEDLWWHVDVTVFLVLTATTTTGWDLLYL